MATTQPANDIPAYGGDGDSGHSLDEAYSIRGQQIIERSATKRNLAKLRQQLAGMQKGVQSPDTAKQVARLSSEIKKEEDHLAEILLKIAHTEGEITVIEAQHPASARGAQQGLPEPEASTSDVRPPATDLREGFLTDAEKRPGGYLRVEGADTGTPATPKKPNTVRDIARTDAREQQRMAPTPTTTASAPARATQPPGIPVIGRGTSAGGSMAALGTRLGGNLRGRLAAAKVSQGRERASVAGELSKLSRTHPPSRFAFFVILCMGVCIDVLNYLVDVTLVVDFLFSVVFLLCIRALINRPKSIQRLFGAMLLVAAFLSVIPIVGSMVGGPLFMIVLFFGVLNPGAKVSKVDKEKIQQSLKKFQQSIQKARATVARLTKLGRKTKGLRTVTTKLAKSKAFKAFSKNSKTMSRLVGSAVAEAIPVIAWIPFNTINAFWTYSDLKKAHIEAKQLLEEYTEQERTASELETAAITEEYRAQIEGVMRAASQQQSQNVEGDVPPTQPALQTSPERSVREAPQRGTMRDIGTAQPRSPVRIPASPTRAPAPAQA